LEKKLTIILSPQKLRLYRKAADKKQYEIADLIGVDRTTYVGYEKLSELELSMEDANKVAEFLKVPLYKLEKLEKSDTSSNNTEQRIFQGENIILPKVAWAEFQETLVVGRTALADIIKNNTDLTQNNTKLTESITDLVKNLLRSTGGNQ
jgi:transcriptional regulator with XRE-family HTH domain